MILETAAAQIAQLKRQRALAVEDLAKEAAKITTIDAQLTGLEKLLADEKAKLPPEGSVEKA